MSRVASSVDQNDLVLQEIQKLKREASAKKPKQDISQSLEFPDTAGKMVIPFNHYTLDISAIENRPPSITNNAIIDGRFEDELTLKEDLIEHYDFEVLLPQVWAHLIAWYEFTDALSILRPVCYDKKSDRHFIDLYLEQNRYEGLQTDSVLDDSLTIIR